MSGLKASIFLLASAALAGETHAADMVQPPDPGYAAVEEVPQSFNWAGPYLGAHLGYGHSSLNFRDIDGCLINEPAFAHGLMKIKGDGFLGGVHGGYNWASGKYLFGVEGDLNWAGIDGTRYISTAPGFDASFDMDFHGTARVRAGVHSDKALFYATGGLAFARMNYSLTSRTIADRYSDNDLKLGWAAGAGVEVAVSQRVSLKLEYMHSEFSGSVFTTPAMKPNRFQFDDHKVDTVTIGISFHL